MSDELRRLFRAAATRPAGELDAEAVAARARRLRAWRRGRLAAAFLLVVAVGAATVWTVLPGDAPVVVTPGPTGSPSPSPTSSGQDAAGREGPCGPSRRLDAGLLPTGFSPGLVPGSLEPGRDGPDVWHWRAGPDRWIEIHTRPVGEPDVEPDGPAPLFTFAASYWQFADRIIVTPDGPAAAGDEDVCGVMGVVSEGVDRGDLFAFLEGLTVRSAETVASAGPPVHDAGLVDAGPGWVTTTEGVLRTVDAGKDWWEASPPAQDPAALHGTWFLDHTHGWTVEVPEGRGPASDRPSWTVWRTTDGGIAWDAAVVGPFDLGSGAVEVVIRFADRETGWLLAKAADSANDPLSVLLTTTDGGRTWTRLETPASGHSVSLATPDLGWLAGASDGAGALHVTRDAGRTWSPVNVRPPDGRADATVLYDVPRLRSPSTGVLPVTLVDPGRDAAALAIYVTDDGGATWALDSLVDVPVPASGRRVPFALTTDGWIYAAPDGSWVRTGSRGGETRSVSAEGRVPNPVVDVETGGYSTWLLVSGSSGCEQDEPCLSIYRDVNGHWKSLGVRASGPSHDCQRDALRRNAPPDDDPGTLDVYFSCNGDFVGTRHPVYRHVRKAPPGDVEVRVTAAVEAWLAGPTPAEQDDGYGAGLSREADLLQSVSVDGRDATVDFTEALTRMGVNTSAGSAVFFRQLLPTVLGDPAVERVTFTIEGDCEAFGSFFQQGPTCVVYSLDEW